MNDTGEIGATQKEKDRAEAEEAVRLVAMADVLAGWVRTVVTLASVTFGFTISFVANGNLGRLDTYAHWLMLGSLVALASAILWGILALLGWAQVRSDALSDQHSPISGWQFLAVLIVPSILFAIGILALMLFALSRVP